MWTIAISIVLGAALNEIHNTLKKYRQIQEALYEICLYIYKREWFQN